MPYNNACSVGYVPGGYSILILQGIRHKGLLVVSIDESPNTNDHLAPRNKKGFARAEWRGGRGRWGGVLIPCTWLYSYDDRPSHPYTVGTEHLGIPPTRQTMLSPSANHRKMSGESREG